MIKLILNVFGMMVGMNVLAQSYLPHGIVSEKISDYVYIAYNVLASGNVLLGILSVSGLLFISKTFGSVSPKTNLKTRDLIKGRMSVEVEEASSIERRLLGLASLFVGFSAIFVLSEHYLGAMFISGELLKLAFISQHKKLLDKLNA